MKRLLPTSRMLPGLRALPFWSAGRGTYGYGSNVDSVPGLRKWTLLSLMLVSLTLMGCGSGTGTPPDVETGRFDAELDGAFDRSVGGEARYRITNGELTGLELVIDSTRGMSVELEPGPLRRKTYQVVEWELLSVDRPGGRPGTVAFLETPGGSFESADGMLDISYKEGDAIGGTFDFEMNGTLEGLPGEPYGLSARGRWIATPLLVD